MNCRNSIDLIARKLEGTLTESESRELDRHLGQCPACRAELTLQRSIEAAIAGRPPSLLPADFAARLARRATACEARERLDRILGYLAPVCTAAAGLALTIVYRVQIASDLAPSLAALGANFQYAFDWIARSAEAAVQETGTAVTAGAAAVSTPAAGTAVSGTQAAWTLGVALVAAGAAVWALTKAWTLTRK